MIAKETVGVLDEVLESDPNPEKKKKKSILSIVMEIS